MNLKRAMELLVTEGEVPLSANTEDELGRLGRLAQELVDVQAHVEEAEARVKELKARERVLAETEIPAIMDELRLRSFTDLAGGTLKVVRFMSASLAGEKMAPAVQWLRRIGHGELVVTDVSTEFRKGEDAKAQALVETLTKMGLTPLMISKVNTSTFKAFLTEYAEAQESVPVEERVAIPFDELGIYRGRRAERTLPKEKKPRAGGK